MSMQVQYPTFLWKTPLFHGKVRTSFQIFQISPEKSENRRKSQEIAGKGKISPEKSGNLKKCIFLLFECFLIID